MKEHSHEVRVTYEETDKMGVVYYANYLRWFEVGRTEFLREEGLTYRDLEDKGVLLPVLESHCNYHHPAFYDDLVRILTKIKGLRRTKVSFEYEIIRVEDNKLLTTGSTVHPFVNNEFKPISLKKKFPKLWEIINLNFDNKK
ncbi:acyl-CoA thioesterase [Orenia marismortui]|uniref:Acyl-CoA thioester hydrolase n=1 Tax=Orenia marismortui TaxID=46469 RepID=A0A4R8HQ31_9FIRM|nr:thioesterase family protein [Orenia marismortui]TDX59031.1 acyl-CoA thioester hydrolase [Orenia marismortui]